MHHKPLVGRQCERSHLHKSPVVFYDQLLCSTWIEHNLLKNSKGNI